MEDGLPDVFVHHGDAGLSGGPEKESDRQQLKKFHSQ